MKRTLTRRLPFLGRRACARGSSKRLRVEQLESRQLLVADVVINEIMYHSLLDDDLEEFIELYNAGDEQADLSGWRLNRGVDFTIPDGTLLGAGQYLVIAADVATFQLTYGNSADVVGGWQGRLSNTGEDVELEDSTGGKIDLVTYSDQGDWGERRLVSGSWEWSARHDGGNKTLELINPAISNRRGQNWAASIPNGGTPGAANSVAATDIAPMIRKAVHFPAVPGPAETVFVTAELIDELETGISAEVMYRDATGNPGAFISAPMFDDGLNNDGEAGDGLWGAALPSRSSGTVVEFYVRATDQGGLSRTWPAPTSDAGEQLANAQYIVSSEAPGSQPFYRFVLTTNELNRFDSTDQRSNDQMNVTFISVVDGVEKIRYNAGMRYRGNGSRNRRPTNVRLNFPHDRFWEGVRAINLNTQFVHSQVVGMTLFDEAGLPTEDSMAVQVRMNTENRANEVPSKTFGSYVRLEVPNNELAENHFPGDAGGNLYKGNGGTFSYRGEDESSYVGGYKKQTNETEGDYSDLINLTRAFDPGQTPDSVFVDTLEEIVDVQQWLRFLAVNALLVNDENGLVNGAGDDYAMYAGIVDPRFVLLPHDMDTVLNEGDTRLNDWNRSLFESDENPRLARLLGNAKYRPLYYAQLKNLAETIFAPDQLGSLLDGLLGGWVDNSTIQNMKSFAEQRRQWVLSQIPPGTPDLLGPQRNLRISEIMYNPNDGEEHEFVELQNIGTETINLQGVRFTDGIEFTFGDIDLAAGEYIVVVKDRAAFEVRYGTEVNIAGEYSGKLSNGGEQITLVQSDPIVETIHNFVYDDQWYPETDGDGFSLVVIDPFADPSTWGEASNWRPSNLTDGSPGEDDDALPAGSLVISEVLSHTDESDGDWIELYNTTEVPLMIGGFLLSDSASDRKKFRIPDDTTIAPGEYLVFTQNADFGLSVDPVSGFGLSELGDEVYLSPPSGVGTIDSVSFGAASREISFGRYIPSDGEADFVALGSSTQGTVNAGPLVGPVVINEIQYNPDDDPAATNVEYIELKNISSSNVRLDDPLNPQNRWQFVNGVTFQFPLGVTIAAGSFAVVVEFNPDADLQLLADFRAAKNIPASIGIYGPLIGSLANSGERLSLARPGSPEPGGFVPQILVDSVKYDDQQPWPLRADGQGASLSRLEPSVYGDDAVNWQAGSFGGSAGRTNTFFDSTPPTTPTDLTADVVSQQQLNLSWTAATDEESSVVRYDIYRDGVLIGSSSTPTFSDTTVTTRVRFEYFVTAFNPDQVESQPSETLQTSIAGVETVWVDSATQLLVVFSDILEVGKANDLASYWIDSLTITGASLRSDGRTVVLTTTARTDGQTYRLELHDLETTSANGLPPEIEVDFTQQASAAGLTVRTVSSTSAVSTLREADATLALPAELPSVTAEVFGSYASVNFQTDSFDPGNFVGSRSFPDETPANLGLVLRTTGVVTVPTAGQWTFAVNASSVTGGVRLRINGEDLLLAEAGQFSGDVFGSRFLAAGDHTLDLVYFAGGENTGLELFAAQGSFASFLESSEWRLVGNSDSGGLPARTLRPMALPSDWSGIGAAGSILYQLDALGAADAAGTIVYETTLTAGQSFSLAATPLLGSARATIELYRANGLLASNSGGSGQSVALDAIPITTTGTYTVIISSGSLTGYELASVLNATLESEMIGGASNDSIGAAQVIDNTAILLSGVGDRLAVLGRSSGSGQYRDVVLADEPIAYWALDDTSGSTAANLGSTGNSTAGSYLGGVVLGGSPLISGSGQVAPFFDGVNDRIEMPSDLQINSGGPYATRTVELWFEAEQTDTRQVLYEEGDHRRGLNIYLDSGRLYMGAFNPINDTGVTTPTWPAVFIDTPVTAAEVHQVTLVLDQTVGSLTGYLDGVAFGQASGVGLLESHLFAVIGAERSRTYYQDGESFSNGNNYFRGTISDVALYDTALSPQKIASHFQSTAGPSGDFFQFDLAAGQSAALALASETDGAWELELLDSAGATVATGSSDRSNVVQSISGFTSAGGGTYFARVGGGVGGEYQLVVTRGAEFGVEPNDTLETAQDITAARSVLGGLDTTTDEDFYWFSANSGELLSLSTATFAISDALSDLPLDPQITLYNPTGLQVATNDNGAADGRNATIEYTALLSGQYKVVVRSSSGAGEYLLSTTAPGETQASLVDVRLSGEAWSQEFVDSLASAGLGVDGFSILDSGSAAPVPWSGINQITFQWSESVAVNVSDISLSGESNGPVSFDSVETLGNKAIWTLSQPIRADRFQLNFSSSLENLLGLGNTIVPFTLLKGDSNQDGTVDSLDFAGSLQHQFTGIGDAGYDLNYDIDGSGQINVIDLLQVRRALGTSLPSASQAPSAAPQAPAAAIDRAFASDPQAGNGAVLRRTARLATARLATASRRIASSPSRVAIDHVFAQPASSSFQRLASQTTLRSRRSATLRPRLQIDPIIIASDK